VTAAGRSPVPHPQACRLRLWTGDHAAIGAQVAAYLQHESPQGPAVIERWRAWRGRPDITARARAIERTLARFWPPVLAEMLALARACRVDPRSVLAEWTAPPRATHGRSCTVFWVPPQLSASGRPLVGRNFDLRLADPERLVAYTMPETGHSHCGMAGRAGRTEGINSAGLVIATTEAQVRPEILDPAEGFDAHGERIGARAAAAGAVPARLATRIALERCATVHQASALLVELAQWTHFNFLLADANGDAAVVEVGVRRTVVRHPDPHNGPWLVATNHFVSSALQGEADFRWLTRQKYRSTWEGLDETRSGSGTSTTGLLTATDCQTVLARRGVAQRHLTLWSQVFEPGAHQLWLAPGRPDRNAFVALPSPGRGMNRTALPADLAVRS